jgi:TolB-like protein
MRKLFVTTTIITLLCAGFAQGQQQGMDMDSQIAKVADSLVSQIKASGKKKVTVLDFTDLKRNTSELGRFIAEQMSMNLVEKRDGFSIMDRANLKTILDEHKLTIEGLVEPDNAKKLGQFAGVDAIVVGTVTPLQDEVVVTANIIATDTAETIGAKTGHIQKGKELAQLSSTSIPKGNESEDKTRTNSVRDKIDQNAKEINGLRIKVDSLAKTSDDRLAVTFIFENVTTNTLGCALVLADLRGVMATKITDKFGSEFTLDADKFAGIARFGAFDGQHVQITQISPSESIDVTGTYYKYPYNNNGLSAPFRIQMQVWIVPQVDGEFPQDRLKQHNFVFDVAKLSGASLQGVAPNNSTPSYYIPRPAVNYNYGGGGKPVR